MILVFKFLYQAKGLADSLTMAGHIITDDEINALNFWKLWAKYNDIVGALQQRLVAHVWFYYTLVHDNNMHGTVIICRS